MKFLYYLLLVLCVFLLYNIVKIISLGIKRLSDFGWGNLVGNVLLLIILVSLVFFMKKRLKLKKRQTKS